MLNQIRLIVKKTMGKENCLILLLLIAFILIRSKYAQGGIEADVGGYAYAAQEMLRGKWPYMDFFVNKPPLIFIIFFLCFKLFGETVLILKTLATFAVLISGIFVYLISGKITSKKESWLAFFIFIFSMSLPFIQGAYANTEIFMIVFVLSSIWLVLVARKTMHLILAGLLMGFAILTKQSAVINLIVTIGWLSFNKGESVKKLSFYLLGVSIPILLLLIVYFYKGSLYDLYFSTFIFNRVYLTQKPLFIRMFHFPFEVFMENVALWTAGLLGALLSIRNYKKDKSVLFLSTHFILSLAFIQYIGEAWPHHYIAVIPFLSILCVETMTIVKSGRARGYFVILIIVSITISTFILTNFVLSVPASQLVSAIQPFERGDWYIQAVSVADYLKKYVEPSDYIYNLGREPQIYFYTQTRSPSRYFFDRPFYLFPETLEETCVSLSVNKPKLVVFTLRPPYFSEKLGLAVWERIKSCGNLQVVKREKVLFAEVWHIK